MAWNFRRRIKIAPGVSLNLSKGGISTSIGPRGAKLTIGPRGVYSNLGIPGTGLYNRRKIGGRKTNIDSSQTFEISNMSNNKSSKNTLFSLRFVLWLLMVGFMWIPIIIVLAKEMYTTAAVLLGFWVLSWIITSIIIGVNKAQSNHDRAPRKVITGLLCLILGVPAFAYGLYLCVNSDLTTLNLVPDNYWMIFVGAPLVIVGFFVLLRGLIYFNYNKKKTKIIDEASHNPKYLIKELDSVAYFGHTIERQYYSDLHDIYSSLSRWCNKMAIHSDEILSLLGLSQKVIQKSGMSGNELLRSVVAIDVYNGYLAMGCSKDLTTKEGLGILFMTNNIQLNRDMTDFEQISFINQKQIEIYNNTISALTEYSEIFKEKELPLAKALLKYDRDLYTEYLVTLYRLLSIIAKADRTISPTEQKYLSYIIKLQQEKETPTEPTLTIYQGGTDLSRLDPLFDEAARWIVEHQEGSTSKLQRVLEIGYNRAGKLYDQLELAGIVGPNKGPTGREVLITDSRQLEQLLKTVHKDDGSYTPPANKNTETKTTPQEQITSTKPLPPKAELDSLIGLASVKKEVKALTNFIKIQQQRVAQGLKAPSVSYHCVFTGNPGTGKTTVARIVADIYHELGILEKGHLVETDRAGLVAEYVGQTAVKTNKIIDSALDGVLFIDEAYSLSEGGANDFGKEAIATLLKRMEDNRDRLVVILAGYTNEMQGFIDINPGLQSRFNRYIDFPDYSADELLQIFESNLKKFDYKMTNEARESLAAFFTNSVAHKDKNFGNARFARNIFEKALEKQACRVALLDRPTREELMQIQIEDF